MELMGFPFKHFDKPIFLEHAIPPFQTKTKPFFQSGICHVSAERCELYHNIPQ